MIYIACPEKYATGGTELLHQLYFELKKKTSHVAIFYSDYSGKGNPINDRFEKYQVEYVTEIDDSPANLLIIPEVFSYLLYKYHNINLSVWWLSVDNYFKSIESSNRIKTWIKKTYNTVFPKTKNKGINFSDKSIRHLVQSKYAETFLRNKGIDTEYLSDYISDNFFKEDVHFTSEKRENRILYNPKKGIEFTTEIINYAQNEFDFVPLENLTQSEIVDLCKTSKIYIDFGNHPGKDRFPRETAILGCVVITGKKGSAKFYDDVKIPDQFKFDDKKSEIPKIIEEIRGVMQDYDSIIQQYSEYRSMIYKEEVKFNEDVNKLWNKYFKEYI